MAIRLYERLSHSPLAFVGLSAKHALIEMTGTGEINAPFTSLRGTHLSGGACVWILGDEEYFSSKGLTPSFGWLEAADRHGISFRARGGLAGWQGDRDDPRRC